jgi:anti-sigma B factor antagonist
MRLISGWRPAVERIEEAETMNIAERVENDITIFVLEGRIDAEGAAELELVLQSAVSEDKNDIVLDMTAVKYIGSAGLRTLADVLTTNKEAGGDLKLAALNPKVMRVFHIIGFDKFFAIYDTPEAAIAGF